MDRSQSQAYPAQVHALSPVLTLQGAVAHVDMPVETGPTLYLPHSQKYPQGYVAYHDPAFTEYFEQHYVQLPLDKGDAVFFNPALFHGAGTNRTSGRRAGWPTCCRCRPRSAGRWRRWTPPRSARPSTRCSAAGRPRARRPPGDERRGRRGGGLPVPDQPRPRPAGRSLAPQSQAGLVHQALAENWDDARLAEALTAQQARRLSQLA